MIQIREKVNYRLHIFVMHREVCILHVHPTSNMIYKPSSFIVYVIYHTSTLLDIVLESKFFFYLFLRSDTKLFVYKVFCWNTVTVSSSPTIHAISAHCHPSWHHIFDDWLQQMPIVRITTRKRRAIKKCKR